MEQETKLPEGLELAQLCCAHASFTGVPDADARTAHEAIRAEHAQRLTLQHHAADLAQRVAELEAQRDSYKAAWYGYHPLADYMQQLWDADKLPAGVRGRRYGDIAVEHMRSQEVRIADMEAQRNTTAAHVASIARQIGDEALQVDDIAVRALALVAEADKVHQDAISAAVDRDTLRTEYDELLVALHGIGRALGLAEGARSPYSITCGVLERVNRLAEIDAQEPVAISKAGNLFWSGNPQDWRGVDCSLYAGPIHAQAVPDGWKLVNAGALAMVVNALRRDAEEGRPVRGEMADELIAAAPEHKA